ncbi:hypothetical protein VY88_03015 [Azospirillum thiophilum]|uniref:Uncharacterized protein n=1 Tax=Azospirillum thiophilum TaxID=528244 RepID=A0AAC8ZU28_9PROT|nr:hypothetical protein [Azospirillum thiophilum]ALG71140.1 hypothetical protein AL072_09695 [Azospirillum thiophilum]KJR65204.1 hypothetical protein VY88_03015 [Azospirillum thiophilum]
MTTVRLVDLTLFHRPSGHRHRLPLASFPGYQSGPADDPPNVTWLPLVTAGADAAVSIGSLGAADGQAELRIGDLVLRNEASRNPAQRFASLQDLDTGQWLRVALDDRPLDLLLAGDYVIQSVAEREIEDGAPLADAVTIWTARAGQPKPKRSEIALPIYDARLDFDTPIQTERYQGTGGYEGPAELKDTLKELPLGHCPMARPTYLGIVEGYHRWSVGGGRPVQDVPRGWSSGVAVARQAASVPSDNAHFTADLATGILTTTVRYADFRVEVLGRTFNGTYRRYVGELIAALATGAGLASTVDVAGMDASPRTVGLFLAAGDGTTHAAAYARFVGSVPRGGWYIGTAGQLVVTRVPHPNAAASIRAYSSAAGTTAGLQYVEGRHNPPAKQVVLRCAHNPSPSTAATDATAADATRWTQEWLEVPSTVDAAIAVAWGNAAKVATIETALTFSADAAAELPAWVAELSAPPTLYELPVPDGAPGVWIGDTVTVEDDIAGFAAGAPVVVYGRTIADRSGGATLSVAR